MHRRIDLTMSVRFLIALLVLASCAVFLELGRMDVYMDNEGQRVAPPYEMLVSGDYVIPTLNGEVYLAKPPLLYWMTAAVYQATGVVNEWTGRVVTATFAVALVIILYLYLRKTVDESIARLAAVGMLAAPYFLERARWADLDIPLAVAIFLAIAALRASWHAAWTGRRIGMMVAAGLLTGAAILLKGPVPLLFLSAALLAEIIVSGKDPSAVVRRGILWTVLCFVLEFIRMLLNIGAPIVLTMFAIGWILLALFHARRGTATRIGIWIGAVVLGILIAMPWGLSVLYRMGWDWIAALLDNQVVERTYEASRINSGTPLYFIIALPIMLFPWGLLLPWHASGLMWRLGDSFYRFSLLTGWLSIFLFSLIAGKEYEYILPATPFLIIATAYHLEWAAANIEMPDWFTRWFRRWRTAVTAILIVAAAVAVPYVLLAEFHITLLAESAVLVIAIFGLLFAFRGRSASRYVALGAAAVLVCTAALLISRTFHYGPDRSPRDLAQRCAQLMDAGYTVESTKTYPPMTWYARRPIHETIDLETVKARLTGDTPYFYLTRDKFIEMMPGEIAWKDMVVAGPIRYRDIVLLTNEAGREIYESLTDAPGSE